MKEVPSRMQASATAPFRTHYSRTAFRLSSGLSQTLRHRHPLSPCLAPDHQNDKRTAASYESQRRLRDVAVLEAQVLDPWQQPVIDVVKPNSWRQNIIAAAT